MEGGAAEAARVPRPLSRAMSYEADTPLCWLLLRYDTVLLVALMAMLNLKQAFYIQTVAQQLEVTWDQTVSNAISDYFNLIFPVLALLTTPAAVMLFARCKHDHAYMSVCGAVMALWAVTQAMPWKITQYAAATLFGPARTLVWAAYFHFFQNPSRYPPSKLGRLIGYSNLVVAIVGDLPPIPLYQATKSQYTDHASAVVFVIIHGVLAALVVGILLAFVRYLRRTERSEVAAGLAVSSSLGLPAPLAMSREQVAVV